MRRVRRAASILVVLAACGSSGESRSGPPAPQLRDAPAPPTASNIARADYIGPDACGDCHEENHARWRRSLHAVMNQLADGVVAPFAGETVAYAGGSARFVREGGAPVMVLTAAGGETRRYRVTRTIGVRGLQEYVGTSDDGVERRLPFGWWLARAGWYPQPYFDSWFDAEYDAAGHATFDAFRADEAPWATRCAWCHNTYPFELRLQRAPGLGHGPERFVGFSERSFGAALELLAVDQLVTVGISCESCHLGGREHAEGAALRFTPVSPRLTRTADAPPIDAGRKDPRVINTICAQCHSTPSPRYPDGAAARNSTEALDMAAGACASAIRCTDCHDPHQRGPDPIAAAAPHAATPHAASASRPTSLDAGAVEACTGCHPALAGDTAARAHSRHEPADASCLDCHMPRLVEGIGTVVRSHRISSPTSPAMLGAAAPNACNLCHLDRSIRWTVDELARGWGVTLAPDAAWLRAYGDLDHPVGTVWLTGRHAAVRLAAAAAFARAGDRAALPSLVALLDAPVAHDRMWTLLAIERLLGRRLTRDEYDPLAPPAQRARQAAALRERAVAWRTSR